MEKKKALVIDDEQIVLDSVSALLSDENYEVDVSLSGREGLDWAIERPYDIVLTDIRTGYASVQSAIQAMKLGAAEYIEKPFEPEELLGAVARALGATPEAEEQTLIHKEEMAKVLERAESDDEFFTNLLENGPDALDEYDLTRPEKLAIVTGDVHWIEDQIGRLTRPQRRMLIFLKVQSKS